MNNAPVDVILAGAFGLVGYWLIKHDFEPAPLLLGMVLGPLMEENLRRALLISRGDWSVFLTRPLSAVLMAIAACPAGAGGTAVAAQEARRGVRRVRELTCGGAPQAEVCSAPGEMLKSKCRLGRAGICLTG